MLELNKIAFFICTIFLLVVLYNIVMMNNHNNDEINLDNHDTFSDDNSQQSSNYITDVYRHPSNETFVGDNHAHEEQLMELVSQVKEKCHLCADNMCTIKCQKSRAVCEKLMGYGYYPDKIPCPMGGSLPGVPTPFNIDDNYSKLLHETIISPFREPQEKPQQYPQPF